MSAVWIRNTSELCIPQREGRGVDRLSGGSVFAEGGRIRWFGQEKDAPEEAKSAFEYDAGGRALLPALIDCHTHLVFGGDRVQDFALRASGVKYEEILARGGGIHTTVEATRAASLGDLIESTKERLVDKRRYGVCTTEIKSGYGLSVEHELRMLEVIRELRASGFDVEATLLAAHVVPKDRPREDYIREIIEVMIPKVAKDALARFVDVFVEASAYSVDEARRIFEAAKAAGLIPRVHAEQITACGGAALAAEVGAASADHLERVSDEDLQAMAQAGTVAVLLPGALTFLGDHAPDLGARLRAAGVEVAVASDTNPGSSPLSNLPLAATLATTQMGLSAEEAIRAVTLGAASALVREDVGTVEVGARARFLLLDNPDSRALIYAFGEPIIRELVDFSSEHATNPAPSR